MRALLATGLLTVSIATSYAADLPSAAPPLGPPPVAVPVPFTWSGFYIGPNAGFGFAPVTVTATTPFATATASTNFDGAVVGGQIGANWQINSFVIGLEADGDWSDQSHGTNLSACVVTCATVQASSSIDWLATGRLRVGYAFDRLLLYATGGGAWLGISGTASATTALGSGSVSVSANGVGYAVGGGLEAALTPNWSVKGEYLFVDAGNIGVTVLGVPETVKVQDNLIRAGFNFRFPIGQ